MDVREAFVATEVWSYSNGFKDGYNKASELVTEAFNKYYDEIEEYDENVNKVHKYVMSALYGGK